MEIKIQRDTNIMLAVSEQEAIQLRTLFLSVPVNVLPIADALNSALDEAGIPGDAALFDQITAAYERAAGHSL